MRIAASATLFSILTIFLFTERRYERVQPEPFSIWQNRASQILKLFNASNWVNGAFYIKKTYPKKHIYIPGREI